MTYRMRVFCRDISKEIRFLERPSWELRIICPDLAVGVAHLGVRVLKDSKAEEKIFDIVGPICETADFIGKDRALSLTEGDLLAIFSTGAYGFSMSSNYNSRPRAAEILVDDNQVYEIRERETQEDLINGELL